MTNIWQLSTECQYETEILTNRDANGEVTIIPVYYTDFDEDEDKTIGHRYKVRWNSIQSIYREDGDEEDWMNKILRLIPINSENINGMFV